MSDTIRDGNLKASIEALKDEERNESFAAGIRVVAFAQLLCAETIAVGGTKENVLETLSQTWDEMVKVKESHCDVRRGR